MPSCRFMRLTAGQIAAIRAGGAGEEFLKPDGR
jgi:hypothetical protein